jgi:uncharacterized membrane protein
MTAFDEAALIALALFAALWVRPWRQRNIVSLLTPMAAVVVLLPWLWALPSLQSTQLELQWSGACLVVLMLGWPLAIPTLCVTGLVTMAIADVSAAQALDMVAWLGVIPATLALAIGALVRRYVGTHPFVYLLGRAFIGSVLCLFAAALLRQWTGHALPGVESDLSVVARWLMAWGDAFVTGMLCAIFVAYRPQWLATWSDALYLKH